MRATRNDKLMSNSKLVLVDGSSYLFRAYHALPKLTSSRGEPTGAIHGVLNMITKLMGEEGTEHFAIVFDAPGKTFRDDIYPEYKANRDAMPEDLRAQIDRYHSRDGTAAPACRRRRSR